MNIICKALTLGFGLFVMVAKPAQATIITHHSADVSAYPRILNGSLSPFGVLDNSVDSDVGGGAGGLGLFGSAERNSQNHLSSLICDIGIGANGRMDGAINSASAKSVSDPLAVLASTDMIFERDSPRPSYGYPNQPGGIGAFYINASGAFGWSPGSAAIVLGAGIFCILFVFTGTTQRQGVVRIESPRI